MRYINCDWSVHPKYDFILVSTTGIILSNKRGEWRELQGGLNRYGYRRVGVGHENAQYVHRMVAETFIPNPNNLPQVNHIDGCKTNNHVDNLEWVTESENMQHAFRIGLKKPSPGTPIRIIETGEVFESQGECARAIGGIQGNIALCLLGRRHTHRGYHFEYVE